MSEKKAEETELESVSSEVSRVKEFLKEERTIYKSLGCGKHKGVYYFGTKVFKEGYGYNAVVTSDRRIYIKKPKDDEVQNLFGLNYKVPFYDEALEHIFTASAVKEWLAGWDDYITIEELFDRLVKLFKEYIYFKDERKYNYLACYRIGGFFLPVWRARARLFIYGEMGSAKSRLTQLLHHTGFNSLALGDWTLASIKMMIESTRAEIHIDDFEDLDEEKKLLAERLIKVGYMRGFKAIKMNDNVKRKPEVYDLFNTTTLNNTKGLNIITLDRCVPIRMPKIANKKYDKEPDFQDPIFSVLRHWLYICGLKYVHKVEEIYEGIKSEKIRGRPFSIIKPELAVAELISPILKREIEDWWLEESGQLDSKNLVDDWEFCVLKRVYELNTEDFVSLKEDIVLPVTEELFGEDAGKKIKGMTRVAGRILSREPRFKKRIVNGKTQYRISKKDLVNLLKAKKIFAQIKEIFGEKDENLGSSICRESSVCRSGNPTKEMLPSPIFPRSYTLYTSTNTINSTNSISKQIKNINSYLELLIKNLCESNSEKLASFEDILANCKADGIDEQAAEKALDYLKWRAGKIFEPKPGFYKILE